MSTTQTPGPFYIVHPDPVERRDTNHIAHVDLAPFGLAGQLEQVWLHDLGDGTYALACIPFMAYGLAAGDVVRLSDDGRVAALVEARGRRVLRLMLVDNADQECLGRAVSEIEACISSSPRTRQSSRLAPQTDGSPSRCGTIGCVMSAIASARARLARVPGMAIPDCIPIRHEPNHRTDTIGR